MSDIRNANGDALRQDGVPVHQAWANVMYDIGAVGKHDRNEHQKFNFRGIDAVMNAVAPALRAHGVAVIPTNVQSTLRDVQTTQGKASRECVVVVDYTIVGPDGGTIVGQSTGEAMDAGDKATPKAMSVAFRTFLLQALCLPTDEPDPDSESHERSAGPTDQERAQSTADRAAKTDDIEALNKVSAWVAANGLADVQVTVGGATGPLARYMAKRISDLTGPDPDADAKAEAVLAETLGAAPVEESK